MMVHRSVRITFPVESTMLFVCCSKSPDEGIKTAPSLLERAGAGSRWLGLPVEHAPLEVNLRLPKLVKVPEEVQDVVVVALGHRDRRSVILQVLDECIPVSSLLRLVAAWCLLLIIQE